MISARAPERILIVVTRRIGDVLLATPLMRSIKRAWPETQIDALVFEGTEGVLYGNPDLTRILKFPERPGFLAHAALLYKLWRRYDVALSLLSGDRPTLYAWVAGRHSLGLLIDHPSQAWKQRLLKQWLPFDALNTHTVRSYLALTTVLNIPALPAVVASWRNEDTAVVDALLGKNCRPLAVLHTYPKFRYKMWHVSGWTEVAHWLLDQGFCVVLTGGRDADERSYVTKISQQVPEALNATGLLSLGATAALISRAAFYVGPDTAVTHLAASTGVPTIALFGPSDPVKWGPWPQQQPGSSNPWHRFGSQRAGNVQLIQARAACVPCRLEGCERHVGSGSDCLEGIPAKTVIQALRNQPLSSTPTT
jgi:heptosyltransferase-3